MSQFFQILGAQRAVDDAVVAAHRERHAMAHRDLIAIVDDWNFCDLAHGENESLRRINHCGKTVDSHPAEV